MVLGQILGELVAGELGIGHDAPHNARLFEDDQVAIHRALSETVAGREDLGDGQWAVRAGEHGHDRLAVRGEALVHLSELRRDCLPQIRMLIPILEVWRHCGECTVGIGTNRSECMDQNQQDREQLEPDQPERDSDLAGLEELEAQLATLEHELEQLEDRKPEEQEQS